MIKTTLNGKVDAVTYSQVTIGLDSISASLNQMNQVFNDIEAQQTYNAQIITMLNNYDSIINELDTIKLTLDNLDKDLDVSIARTRKSEERVNTFINKLDIATKDISTFSDGIQAKKTVTEFKRAFLIKDDLVFLSFPLLIAIIITFTSLILSNMFIIRQINKPSYIREIISPTNDIDFLISDYFINLFFIFIQAVVMFIIGIYWFHVPLETVYPFALVIFISSSIFIFIGMAIGYIVKSESLSMLLTVFLVMLFVIFSDILSPSVLATPVVNFFVNMNPFVILQKLLTDIFIINRPIQGMIYNIMKLSSFLLLSLVIAYIAKKISKENIIQ